MQLFLFLSTVGDHVLHTKCKINFITYKLYININNMLHLNFCFEIKMYNMYMNALIISLKILKEKPL